MLDGSRGSVVVHRGTAGNCPCGGRGRASHRDNDPRLRDRSRRLDDCIGNGCLGSGDGRRAGADAALADRVALARCAFPARPVGCGVSRGRQSGRRDHKSLRAGLWKARSGARPGTALLPSISCRHEPGSARRRCVYFSAELGVHVAHIVGAGDGSPPSARQRARRLHLLADGELRHAVIAPELRSPRGSGRRLRIRRHPQ